MYVRQIEEKRKPWQKGNIICDRCDAEFMAASDDMKWYTGSRGSKNSTSGSFHARSQIPDNECPVCRTVFEVENESTINGR